MLLFRTNQLSSVFAGALLLGLTFLAPAGAQSPTGARSDAWRSVDCSTFELKGLPDAVDCGYVTVPLRHADPSGPTIELATVVVPSSAAETATDPLFIAQGGPGGSSIETYVQLVATDPVYHPAPNRELVIWDQRGTRFSRPALSCPEVSAAELRTALSEASEEAAPEDEIVPYRECGERLAAEAGDLSAFNSVENANDVEALRRELGYEQINFYGVSYGTELGQFVMRQHPERLRSVVLDAVVPTTFNLITDVALVKERIGEKYFESCEEEERCREAFPDLGARFLALLDRLDAEPVTVDVPRLEGAKVEAYSVRLTGSDLEDLLYEALYSQELQPFIPYVVDRADHGDYSLVSWLLLPMSLFDESTAVGMYLSVVCAERGTTDPDENDYSGVVPRLAREAREGAQEILDVCRLWNIQALPGEVREPVVSDVPTLLLSGDFDPITPPQFASQVGETLSRDFHVVFPKGTHGQAVSDPCANGIIQAFLDDPGTPPEQECAQAPRPAFLVPSDLTIVPPLREVLMHPGTEGLERVALGSMALLLALLVMATAPPVYAALWWSRRGRRKAEPAGGAARAEAGSRLAGSSAGWLASLAFLALLASVLGVGFALGADLLLSPMLLLLGAIQSEFRWVLVSPIVFSALVALMLLAGITLWRSGHRAMLERGYYSVLIVAGLFAVWDLWQLGLLTALFQS